MESEVSSEWTVYRMKKIPVSFRYMPTWPFSSAHFKVFELHLASFTLFNILLECRECNGKLAYLRYTVMRIVLNKRSLLGDSHLGGGRDHKGTSWYYCPHFYQLYYFLSRSISPDLGFGLHWQTAIWWIPCGWSSDRREVRLDDWEHSFLYMSLALSLSLSWH